MTFVQVAVAVVNDSDFWRSLSEALGTLLLGLLAWFGRRIVKVVDSLDGKLNGALDRFSSHNDKVQGIMSALELRVEKVEARLPERRQRKR